MTKYLLYDIIMYIRYIKAIRKFIWRRPDESGVPTLRMEKRGRTMLISERIYQYLEEKGMSQYEFAKKTGISQSTVSDWRRKGTNPSADKIMIICDVLGISPYELLLDTDSKNPREFKQTDYVVIDKKSKEYELIQSYEKLDQGAKKRLEGYLQALTDLVQ